MGNIVRLKSQKEHFTKHITTKFQRTHHFFDKQFGKAHHFRENNDTLNSKKKIVVFPALSFFQFYFLPIQFFLFISMQPQHNKPHF